MKDILMLVLITLLFGIIVYQARWTADRMDMFILEVSKGTKERDQRQFQMHNRIQELEEDRDILKRVRDIEKQLRVYCTGNKLEMCGMLKPVKDER